MTQESESTPNQPKRIVANSIELVDLKGVTRIRLDAGNGDDNAVIHVYGRDSSSVRIEASLSGDVYLRLCNEEGKTSAVLKTFWKNNSMLVLCDHERGGYGTVLGAATAGLGLPSTIRQHDLILYREGKIHWSTSEDFTPDNA